MHWSEIIDDPALQDLPYKIELNKWGVILSTKLPDFAVNDNACVQLYKEAAQHFADASRNARFSSEISPLR